MTISFDASAWKKARASGANANCIEANLETPGMVGLRDSKIGAGGPVIVHTMTEWTAWTAALVEGRVTSTSAMTVTPGHLGGWILTTPAGVTLHFNSDEVNAFLHGLQAGEFAAA